MSSMKGTTSSSDALVGDCTTKEDEPSYKNRAVTNSIEGRQIDRSTPQLGAKEDLYSHQESQYMLDFILFVGWSEHVKDDWIWRLIYRHKLLQNRIGQRSVKSMKNHFLKIIMPRLANMIVKAPDTNAHYIVLENDLKAYMTARLKADALDNSEEETSEEGELDYVTGPKSGPA